MGYGKEAREKEGGGCFGSEAAAGEDEAYLRGGGSNPNRRGERHCYSHPDGRAVYCCYDRLFAFEDGEGDAAAAVAVRVAISGRVVGGVEVHSGAEDAVLFGI